MKRITSRFVLMIATAAVAPLILYGVVSVSSLRSGTRESVTDGNLKVAKQVAEQIDQYMRNNTRQLQAAGTELSATALSPWQQDRILKDYVLQFREFREVTIFDRESRPLATSAVGPTRLKIPELARQHADNAYIAPLKDDDLLPATTIAVRLTRSQQDAGWIVGEIKLEELWRTVDKIRVGNEGYTLIIGEDGRLIAHGNPDEKKHIADADQSSVSAELKFASEFRTQKKESTNYFENGRQMLAVAAAATPNWTIIVEQPTSEAFATAHQLELQLFAAIVLALIGTMVFGYIWGRTFIRRIFALTKVTRSIAEGKLDTRVVISGQDEIHELGDAFNSMADRLVELQEDIRKQERQVMFGRIAAGLVHDLSHPIQNIGNGCKLIVKMWDDADYRETFRRMFERELQLVKRVLEDLQNIAKPIPLERFPVELNRSVGETIESMQALAETAGITLQSRALDRRRSMSRGTCSRSAASTATWWSTRSRRPRRAAWWSPRSKAHGDRVQIRIVDTGCGIPADRLQAVFEDFVTTKRRGLGLGLAISRKIVEQLGGRITVASEVGKGTTFVIDFPRTSARPMAQAAG